jgi:hypothetical protein
MRLGHLKVEEMGFPWVVPLGMSCPKFLQPIQFQDNIGLTLKNKSFEIIYQRATQVM